MKKITLLIFMCLFGMYTNAQTFQWAKQLAGTGSFSVDVKDILSRNGENYICGTFTGTVDFDPLSGTANVNNKTANGVDGFMARYDGNGDLVWVATTNLAGNEDYIAMQIGSNGSSTNLNEIVVLQKTGTNSFNFVSHNSFDGVVVTTSAVITSSGVVNPTSFTNISQMYYIVGSFTGTLTYGSSTLTSAGGFDAFCLVFRRNPSFSINSARSYGGAGDDYFNHIEDNGGTKIWLSGSFTNTFNGQFSSGTNFSHTSAGFKDAIVLEVVPGSGTVPELRPISTANVLVFGSTGEDEVTNTSYAKNTFGGVNDDYLFVGGSFSGTVDFNPSATISNETSAGGTDAFIVQYNVSSSNFAYGYSNIQGGAQNDRVSRIKAINTTVLGATNSGYLYYAIQRSNFLGGSFISLGGYDRTGAALGFGGNMSAQAAATTFKAGSIFTVSNSDIYLCGTFNGTSYFEPGTTNNPLTFVAGGVNGFLQKFGNCTQSASAPSITANVSTNICSGNSVTLTASGSMYNSAKWVWYSGSCGGTLLGDGAQITVTPTVTTTYYARGEGGCVANGACSSAVTITVNPAPIASTTVSGNTITGANTGEAHIAFSWVNCATNTIIAGANSLSYTPTVSGDYKIRFTAANGCIDESACVFINPLSISDFEKLGIRLYPNPVKHSFVIDGDIQIEKLTIYNLLGQEVKTFTTSLTEYSIEELAKGTYVLQLISDKGSAKTKIVKE